MTLNPMYAGENQLQAINHTANRIEKETGIAVVRCHLGNPLAPQFEGSNRLLAEYFSRRGSNPSTRGYADVAGNEDIRLAIAKALCIINRLPANALTGKNIIGVTGGTGALNVALSIFSNPHKAVPPTVLIPEPFYPPWLNIAERLQCDIATFPLCEKENYLLSRATLEESIQKQLSKNPEKDILLLYHYPNNPTGKTLTEPEAIQMAQVLNELCHLYPNFHLIQEDLYLATVAPELGIYTPLPHLSEEARQRTIWLNSPSKMGLQQDRAAVIAAFNPDILLHLRGAVSFDILGTSTPALLATANTLMHIAQGGVNAFNPESNGVENHRFVTAGYYQTRIRTFYATLKKIESRLNKDMLPAGIPQGAYYLYPSFHFLLNQPIPESLLPVFNGKTHFRNADDITDALANAHLLGLRPVTVASGTLFTHDTGTMHIRISTVDPVLENLLDAAETITGLIQKVLKVELGARFFSIAELKEKYPVRGSKAGRQSPFFRWNRTTPGGKREWSINA